MTDGISPVGRKRLRGRPNQALSNTVARELKCLKPSFRLPTVDFDFPSSSASLFPFATINQRITILWFVVVVTTIPYPT
jgi:hypothetical protein